ncbi:MAG: DUF4342 domain-containing protein [Ignavibacteriae bacterium]|nr:DUF4342 domain-containing protein [Ignavibacteriota bacterium]MCB9206474.1 DUF4342 domain-containing protein [Ignavibacteriales bacterium]MCB9219393.1 DUF4342 domain-containing protein [Ignavibacteriales bacterium]MCB9259929.1 DUF4342 domain-containing protein [Ignavibacteriales bacterium]
MFDKVYKTANEMINKIEELIKEGNLKRIIIRDHKGDAFIELPVIVFAVIAIAAPIVTAISAIAGYAAKFSVEIITKENSSILLLCENNTKSEVD